MRFEDIQPRHSQCQHGNLWQRLAYHRSHLRWWSLRCEANPMRYRHGAYGHCGNARGLARHTRSPPPMMRRPDFVLFHALIAKRKEYGYCSMVVSRRLSPCSLPGMCWNIALVLLMLVRPGQILHDTVPAMVLPGRKYRDFQAVTCTRVVKGGINIEAIRYCSVPHQSLNPSAPFPLSKPSTCISRRCCRSFYLPLSMLLPTATKPANV